MRLSELDPQFIRSRRRGQHLYIVNVADIAKAQGIRFLCPKCFQDNGGPKGTHQIICWSPEVDAELEPGPGRWDLVGTSYEDLSLRGSSNSIQLLGGCNWHGFVENGAIRHA